MQWHVTVQLFPSFTLNMPEYLELHLKIPQGIKSGYIVIFQG